MFQENKISIVSSLGELENNHLLSQKMLIHAYNEPMILNVYLKIL